MTIHRKTIHVKASNTADNIVKIPQMKVEIGTPII